MQETEIKRREGRWAFTSHVQKKKEKEMVRCGGGKGKLGGRQF
jgi:hypothetical protein